MITPTDRCIPPLIIDHNPGDIIPYCCTDGMCRGLIPKWEYQRPIRCISAIRAGIDSRTARWTPTRRARGRDEWGDTTPPPHDGKLYATLLEELEDGATIGPVASPPSMLIVWVKLMTLVFGPRSRPREEFLDRKNGMVRCPDP